MNAIDRYFEISASGSNVRREIIGGITTFVTMSYIVFVQPTVLSAAGMPFGGVLVATCLSSAIACFLMGTIAKYPFALAPGMGENFLFAFGVCGAVEFGGMGFSWQAGLAIVLISGLIFLALSMFRVREKMMDVFPTCLKNAIGPAIGLFIAFIGLQWAGIVKLSPATMVELGGFHTGPALITVAGVLIIAAFLAHNAGGGILIGIVATSALGYIFKVIPVHKEAVQPSLETAFKFDFAPLFEQWDKALIAIALFFFLDLFDTIGTLVGVGKQAGYIKEDERLPRAGRAFMSDALGTCVGAVLGTSTVTSYIESATGVAAGARTGLASIVTGICFVLAIAFAPLIAFVGQDIGPAFYGCKPTDLHVAMYPAVAPALIVVGFLMMAPLRKVQWDDLTESMPAFLTMALMAFGYGITEGIAVGCISYVAIKVVAGKFREPHPIMYVIALALILRYAFLMH